MNFKYIFIILLVYSANVNSGSDEQCGFDDVDEAVDLSSSTRIAAWFSSPELPPQDPKIVEAQKKLREQWFYAVTIGDLQTIESLIGKIDVNVKDKTGRTALIWAVYWGHEEIVKFLLHVASINIKIADNDHHTALMYAQKHKIHAIEKLIKNRLPQISDVPGIANQWFSAARAGNLARLKSLIDEVDVNIKDLDGRTALIWTAFGGAEAAVKFLLTVPSIDINIRDKDGKTALMDCYRHESIMRLLLNDPRIDINIADEDGNTALIIVVGLGDENIIKLFLNAPGLRVNDHDQNGMTALIWAVINKHENIVNLLLQVPTLRINQSDKDGKTALIWAQESDCHGIVDVIQDRMDQLKAQALNTISGYTNLSSEADRQQKLEELRSAVMQLGTTAIVDKKGYSLFSKAFASNRLELVLCLLNMTEDPRTVFAGFPLELVNPTSDLFKWCLDLAYIKPNENPKNKCAHCSKQNCTDRCGKCHKIYYCSEECQKKDWLRHKAVCKQA